MLFARWLIMMRNGQGTSQDQDARFKDKEKKLMKSMKFPKEFDTKVPTCFLTVAHDPHVSQVDTKKVKLEVITPWISGKVTDLLGFEDEVVIGYIAGLLEAEVCAS